MTRLKLSTITMLLLAALTASAPCRAATEDKAPPPLENLKQRYRRDTSIPFPPENPYSDAKAALGKALFFDPRLSGAGTIACATCHNPALGWKDGLARGVGHDAKSLPRATPTVLDLAWADLLMWDGRKNGLEDQATGPIGSTSEMDMDLKALPGRLGALAGYRRMFKAAFGTEEVSVPRLAQAIATYERTLVSNLAPFDRWIAGDESAIPEAAKRGFVLFNGRGRCAACHNTWRFTDDGFHDIGLPSADEGRGAQLPGQKMLQHAFKTPTLRNVAERGPYMHDGSVGSLADVIAHYDTGFVSRPSLSPEMRRLNLTAAETGDLIAFLHTLSSKDDPVTFPTLPSQDSQ